MSLYRCYSCGFETRDRADFLGAQGTSTHHWVIFICPQCSLSEPPVAEVDFDIRPPWPEPQWKLVETNNGLYVTSTPSKNGGTISSPINPKHPLLKAPASLLRSGLEGSVLDHHHRLVEAGKARSRAFHAECEAIKSQHGDHEYPREQIDGARERHKVGPHDERITHDGPRLMLGIRRAA